MIYIARIKDNFLLAEDSDGDDYFHKYVVDETVSFDTAKEAEAWLTCLFEDTDNYRLVQD